MNKMLTNVYCLVSAIGAINWGFVAFFNFNVVAYLAALLGFIPFLDKIIYAIVALCGIMVLVSLAMGTHR